MKLAPWGSLLTQILPASATLRRALFRCVFAGAAASWAPPADAHEVRPAIATIQPTAEGEVAIDVTLNLEAAIAGIGAGHADSSESPAAQQYDRLRTLAPDALRAEFDRFAAELLRSIALEVDGRPMRLEVVSVAVPEVGDIASTRVSQLRLVGRGAPGAQRLSWRVDRRLGDSVVRLRDPASDRIVAAEFVPAGETSGMLSMDGLEGRSWASVFAEYLAVGFTHIVPKGLDHILFVVGLFLLSPRASVLLWQVTAFTVAHTATLALSMLGIVELSPAVVEPLIAASIVYVAAENLLTDRLHRWRPLVVFGFGLLHGLGFAGVLQEIGPAPGQFVLSLLAFNLGVELGQLAIVGACFLAVGWTVRYRWRRIAVVIPGSLAIAIVAGFWVLERTGLA